jgi:hypothetical protein
MRMIKDGDLIAVLSEMIGCGQSGQPGSEDEDRM